MGLLAQEQRTLEEYLTGLDDALSKIPLFELEKPGSPGIQLFREAKGAGLLIPREYTGLGASPLEAIRIQRAIASRSPSLAIASTMHHFSVATLVEICATGTGPEGLLLEAIAQQRLLVASGFAEGQTGRGILTPTMQAKRTSEGYVVNGSKKPCSLSWSMDLLTASVMLSEDSGAQGELAVVLIPRRSAGLDRRKFWENWVLAGAESDEVILRDVLVPERLVFRIDVAKGLDPVQTRGFLWFELLISASYLGMVSALVDRVINQKKGEPADRVSLAIEVEGAMAALEGVAHAMMMSQPAQDALARILFVRYAVQGAIARASAHAMEVLGGMSFIRSPEISYLVAATHALAFHPPSRISMSQSLADYLAGGSVNIP